MIYHGSLCLEKSFIGMTLGSMGERILTVYDKHYERDGEGKIRMAPAQAMETWQDVINPLPDVAGLRYVIAGLARERIGLSRTGQAAIKRLQRQLPQVPTRQVNGKPVLSPAEKVFGEPKNNDDPERTA